MPWPSLPVPEAPSPRDRIVHTAHALFYRDGVRATGVDRVIAEAGVAKVTFYRHFPSKNELVLAYLAHRHALWMAGFTDALARHAPAQPPGIPLDALVPALADWLGSEGFRGCAFTNIAAELGDSVPGVIEAVRQHKRDMGDALRSLLPAGAAGDLDAEALALAVEGAIVVAQREASAAGALAALQRIVGRLAVRP